MQLQVAPPPHIVAVFDESATYSSWGDSRMMQQHNIAQQPSANQPTSRGPTSFRYLDRNHPVALYDNFLATDLAFATQTIYSHCGKKVFFIFPNYRKSLVFLPQLQNRMQLLSHLFKTEHITSRWFI